jgi:hypothetical protein
MNQSTTNFPSGSSQGNGIVTSSLPDTDQLKTGFVARLDDLGLISASGADAVNFIHGQLSNDIEHLSQAEARLAGYSTPKGRLLATLLVWKASDGLLMQLPAEILPALQKRLQMYVMRAKVALADASGELVILGLGGARAAEALSPWFPALPAAPYARADAEAGTLIRVADAFGAPRYQWIATAETADKAWPGLTAILAAAPRTAWQLADIDAGVPQITAATQDLFVAQMVNLEIVGGVSFKKGCYPGQEIIARSQYLGKNKRRMLPAFIDLPEGGDAARASAGSDVYSEADPEQPCGTIVNATPLNGGRIACLVSLKHDMIEKGSIRLGSAEGPALHLGELPYALPDSLPSAAN